VLFFGLFCYFSVFFPLALSVIFSADALGYDLCNVHVLYLIAEPLIGDRLIEGTSGLVGPSYILCYYVALRVSEYR